MTQSPEQKVIPYSPSKLPAGSTLIFAPHPDDEVLGCGGTIIRHLQHGDPVKLVIVNDGGFPLNESQKTEDYPEIRKLESLTAAKIIGYGQPLFLNFKGGFLKADEILIARLVEIIRIWLTKNHFITKSLIEAGFKEIKEPLGILPTRRSFFTKLEIQFAMESI